MLAFILAILALGVLVIVHESGHFLVARASKMRVDLFSVGFGPPVWRMTRGETTYQVAAVPLGGFVQIAGLTPGEEAIDLDDPRAYPNRPVWQRFMTIFAGPWINYMFAVLVFIGLNLAIGVRVEIKGQGAVVVQALSNHPAAQAGIKDGDDIVAIGGKPVTGYEQVSPMIDASGGKPLAIEFLRDGQRMTLTVTPRKDKTSGKMRIGIRPGPSREERKHLGPWKAITDGFIAPAWLTYMNIKVFADAFRGGPKPDVGGPVEIVEAMHENIKRGWVSGLEMVAFISTMLGFFNLLPFPALDGGRLVFLGWEIVTRRPVNQKVEQVVHGVGMVILLLLVGFLLIRGVSNKIRALWGG